MSFAGRRPSGDPVPEAKLLLDCKNTLGECPLWDSRSSTLYWVDIDGKTIHVLHRQEGEDKHKVYDVAKSPGAIAFVKDTSSTDSLVVMFDDGPRVLCLASGDITVDGDVFEADMPHTRMNDARCDRHGNIIAAGYNKSHHATEEACSSIYQISSTTGKGEKRLSMRKFVKTTVRVGNGITFSPDGTIMYFCDSPTRRIMKTSYDPKKVMKNEEEDELMEFWCVPPRYKGVPDGACTDKKGNVWTALFGDGVVVEISEEGHLRRVIGVPAPNVTCCCFGSSLSSSSSLSTLYITTARKKMSEEDLKVYPESGGVFAYEIEDVEGLEEETFNL